MKLHTSQANRTRINPETISDSGTWGPDEFCEVGTIYFYVFLYTLHLCHYSGWCLRHRLPGKVGNYLEEIKRQYIIRSIVSVLRREEGYTVKYGPSTREIPRAKAIFSVYPGMSNNTDNIPFLAMNFPLQIEFPFCLAFCVSI